ncbi:MAG: DNA-binding response regulator [Candidatus Handelsmanbacteria bacterium RIFCSPLOWO2_12_FULL_64_10]|uniref:DNA-binding response regulator n=1 Tax=Handelsmanbacteria sp. (strain RIFCSPLOWO2_12_FULL_64_10) TaxID=1817868 RepID=A0A1F6D1V4_HANXR|nr:MAG: DNA-binding response regulator [Candidatus Handelsmanbacteria bacterium RIFCSPLOWO2_12_FULL_64_10]
MGIRILLADDHRIMRSGLRSLVEKEPDMEVVAEAEDGRMAVKLVEDLSPDVVVMDIGMPGLNGIEATRQITERASGVRVVALSMHSDRQFVAGMLGAGASGYLLKDCTFSELVRAVRTVAANQVYLSPCIAGVVVEDYVRHTSASGGYPDFFVLTAREREVLQLLTEGETAKEVASCLRVSVKTVENHRQKIMEKLDLHSIAKLTKYAIRAGLTSLDA